MPERSTQAAEQATALAGTGGLAMVLADALRAVLASDGDVAGLAHALFQAVAPALDADVLVACRIDAGTLRRVAAIGFDAGATPPGAPNECGLCAEVARAGAHLHLDRSGVARHPDAANARRLGIGAFAGCPLRARSGEPLGVLAIASRRRDVFSGDELRTVEAIGSAMALAWERADAERALRQSHERYRALLAHSSEGIYRFEFDPPVDVALPVDEQLALVLQRGRLAECNDTFARMYGHERGDEMVGAGLASLLPMDVPETAAYLRAVIANGHRATEVVSREVDRDGNPKWFANNFMGVIEDGHLRRVWGMQRDVTERTIADEELRRYRERLEQLVRERTAELEHSHQRLRLSERMAAIGTLAAGIGHDLGNLLLPVRLRLDTLLHRRLDPEARADVVAIQGATEYVQRLTGGLRTLALDPFSDVPPEGVALADWWPEAELLFRNVLPAGMTLRADIAPNLPPVRIGRPALTQAVLNLVQNAGDAVRATPSPEVRVEAAPDPDGSGVLVRVVDNGQGMDEEVRRRCLEPFFTTRARGLSTGLGLALVHGLVEHAGGTVRVDSTPGQGTAFTLRIPAADPAPARRPARGAAVRLDDVRIRAIVTSRLRALRFDVHEHAGDPPDDTRVLVSDSPAAARAFLAADPARRALLLLAEGAGPHDAGDAPGLTTLQPPLRPGAIRDALTRLVDACAPAQGAPA